MKHPRGLSILAMALLVGLAAAEEGERETVGDAVGVPPAPATAIEAAQPGTDWLEAVWAEVDELTVEKDFELQETVTTSGVRGAEARDEILDKLYYRGSRQKAKPEGSEGRPATEKEEGQEGSSGESGEAAAPEEMTAQ